MTRKISYEEWEIENTKGQVCLISTETVLKHIKHISQREQEAIEDVINRIANANGNVNAFLKCLATAIV